MDLVQCGLLQHDTPLCGHDLVIPFFELRCHPRSGDFFANTLLGILFFGCSVPPQFRDYSNLSPELTRAICSQSNLQFPASSESIFNELTFWNYFGSAEGAWRTYPGRVMLFWAITSLNFFPLRNSCLQSLCPSMRKYCVRNP